jgi:hypothetical protein
VARRGATRVATTDATWGRESKLWGHRATRHPTQQTPPSALPLGLRLGLGFHIHSTPRGCSVGRTSSSYLRVHFCVQTGRVLACSLAAGRAGPEGFACRVGLTGLVAPASAATLLGWVWCVCECVPGPLECVCVGPFEPTS